MTISSKFCGNCTEPKATFKFAKDKVNPDVAWDATRNKIFKLEKDLEVLSDSTAQRSML